MSSTVCRSVMMAVAVAGLGLSACGSDKGGGSGDGADGDGDTSDDPTAGDGGNDDGGNDDGGDDDGSDDGGGDDGDTGSFVGDPDAGGPALMCDPIAQDCPEGEKCTPASLDGDGVPEASKCSPIDANPNQRGDECTWAGPLFSGEDDCDKGLMCFPASIDAAVPDGTGFCIGLCEGDPTSPTCGATNEICEVANDGALPWCLEECDPLLQECREGHACYPHTDRFACKIIGQEGAYGEECGLNNACNPGLFCADATAVANCTSMVACCTEYCDVSLVDNSQCSGSPDGMECVSAYGENPPTPGYENAGVCLLPA